MKRKGGDFITKKTDYQSVFITEQWNEEQIMQYEVHYLEHLNAFSFYPVQEYMVDC